MAWSKSSFQPRPERHVEPPFDLSIWQDEEETTAPEKWSFFSSATFTIAATLCLWIGLFLAVKAIA